MPLLCFLESLLLCPKKVIPIFFSTLRHGRVAVVLRKTNMGGRGSCRVGRARRLCGHEHERGAAQGATNIATMSAKEYALDKHDLEQAMESRDEITCTHASNSLYHPWFFHPLCSPAQHSGSHNHHHQATNGGAHQLLDVCSQQPCMCSRFLRLQMNKYSRGKITRTFLYFYIIFNTINTT
jgi:hypothetical protein